MFNFPLGVSVSKEAKGMLSSYKEHGINKIELSLQPDSTQSWAEEMVLEIKKLGLTLWSLHLPFGKGWDVASLDQAICERTIERASSWMELGSSWGAQIAVIHSCLEPIEPQARQQKLLVARESLINLGKIAKGYGIKLAVECLPRTCLGNTSEEIKYLTDQPDLYVCCDVNHLFCEKPQEFIRALGNKVITTHISDWDGKDERHWLPGQGINDWKEICTALVNIDYKGPFLFEVESTPGSQLKKSWENLWKEAS